MPKANDDAKERIVLILQHISEYLQKSLKERGGVINKVFELLVLSHFDEDKLQDLFEKAKIPAQIRDFFLSKREELLKSIVQNYRARCVKERQKTKRRRGRSEILKNIVPVSEHSNAALLRKMEEFIKNIEDVRDRISNSFSDIAKKVKLQTEGSLLSRENIVDDIAKFDGESITLDQELRSELERFVEGELETPCSTNRAELKKKRRKRPRSDSSTNDDPLLESSPHETDDSDGLSLSNWRAFSPMIHGPYSSLEDLEDILKHLLDPECIGDDDLQRAWNETVCLLKGILAESQRRQYSGRETSSMTSFANQNPFSVPSARSSTATSLSEAWKTENYSPCDEAPQRSDESARTAFVREHPGPSSLPAIPPVVFQPEPLHFDFGNRPLQLRAASAAAPRQQNHFPVLDPGHVADILKITSSLNAALDADDAVNLMQSLLAYAELDTQYRDFVRQHANQAVVAASRRFSYIRIVNQLYGKLQDCFYRRH